MDLPDEELQQPLVEPPQVPRNAPASSPQHAGASPKRGHKHKDSLRAPGLAVPKQPTTSNYVAMHNAPSGAADEEEKEDAQHARREGKQQLPYAAPNVHPYAVPQYQPHIYGGGAGRDTNASGGGGGGGWGTSYEPSYDDARSSNIDIAVSGMYTLAAALTIIQGFGMLVLFSYSAGTASRHINCDDSTSTPTDDAVSTRAWTVALGLYTMAFGTHCT